MNKTFIILSPGFPKDEADSTCLPFPQLFVQTLKRLNPSLNIIVIAFQYPFDSKEYTWHGVHVIPFSGKNKGKLNRLLLWNAVWKKLKKIMHENEVIGILNFWLGECALIGKFAGKKFQVKNFTWMLGQDAKKNNRYFSLVKPTSENLIALSDFLSEEFYRNNKIKPAHVVPPGIDINDFSQRSFERDIDIMGTGSLISLKQYDVFIKIIQELAKTNPNIKTIICGKGPQQHELQKMIDSNGLLKNIDLKGELDHREILRLMQRSKIFLHTSSYEGFGVVILESLYAGASVVSFSKPMNTVFQNHYVVSSEKEMVGKLAELLADSNKVYEKLLPYPIEETCYKILSLYGY